MERPETYLVTLENGPRPAGHPDRCFYCKASLGERHAEDCVLRERTVVLRVTVEYAVRVPASWDSGEIEFHRNESSSCASNLIAELDRLDEKAGCLCRGARWEYLREADEVEDALAV